MLRIRPLAVDRDLRSLDVKLRKKYVYVGVRKALLQFATDLVDQGKFF